MEFKDRYTRRVDEDIVAFANAGGVTLLLGVLDLTCLPRRGTQRRQAAGTPELRAAGDNV